MASILALVNNVKTWISTIAISSGSADADKIVATNGNGQIDNSFVNWASPGAIGATTASTGRFTTLNGANTTDTTAFLVSQFNGLRTLSLGSTGVTTNTNLTVSAATASGSLGVGAIVTQGGISAAKELRAGAGLFGVTATITASASVSDIQQWRDTANGIVSSINIDGSFKKLRSATYNAADATGTLGFFLGYNGDTSDNGLVKSFRTFLSRPASGSAVLSLDSWAGFDSTTPTAIPSSSWVSRLAFAGASFVGINTNTPGAALQVNGGLAISSSSTAVSDPGAGNLSIAGTLKIGASGSTITRILPAVSSALDTVSVAAQTASTISVTVTGVQVGDQVNANASSATPNTNFSVHGYVSAANTVTVVAYNRAATSQNFSGNVRVLVVG
ncbi:MAG: hypothetical protein KME13_25075 [Myxacorys californica WJT36-NPBG1]|jgi:hypothetical protein|nr:hypothetical protein [Myxacorys californica WJT36-NPBG1]